MTDTSTSADFSSIGDSADTSAEAAPSQADSYDEGDGEYESLPDYGEIDELDEGDADYASFPDYGGQDSLDPELSYDELPDPDQADPSAEPQSWAPDETVQLHADDPSGGPPDTSSEVEAARGEVAQAIEQGERQQEARDAVDAAYAQAEDDGVPPNTIERFESDAQQAIDDAPSTTGAKEVEFKEPGPAKEVEFKEPTEATSPDAAAVEQHDAPQDAELSTEVHSPEEQRVVDDAKASLGDRQSAGEVLGGDPVGRADQWHEQGHNERDFQQDCGVAAVTETLKDCGVNATESEVVDRAVAEALCDTSHSDGVGSDGTMDSHQDNGGTTGQQRCELLQSYGVESKLEYPQGPEELAEYVENGHGVITALDAYEMWDVSPSDAPPYYDEAGMSRTNHAVQVTGTIRDGSSGELTGFVINDTGRKDGAGVVIPIDSWHACWTNTSK